MAISSPGLGSNLDVNGIVAKLMQAESQPLLSLRKKEASYTAKLSAFGNLSGALGAFQNALSSLSSASNFQSIKAGSSDSTVVTASSSKEAVSGSYAVNVLKLAQSQTLSSKGVASTTTPIGTGTLTFQFGEISGGTFGDVAGGVLSSGVASGGITNGALTLNGAAITTGSSTNSAQALATAINAKSGSTGITATAQTTDSGALNPFTTTTIDGYSLVVGGVSLFSNQVMGVDAAAIDAKVAASSTALANAGITVTGTAAAGDLHFKRTDGGNLAIAETLGTGDSGGFFGGAGTTTTNSYSSSVTLNSANAITVGGTNPAAAGFSAGVQGGTYSGANFTPDAARASASVVIDSTNSSLQGIRDAINKAGIGVTATIVSDGSATPNRLVISSNKTGSTSSLKISVGGGDPALENLLNYDPAGTQNLTQTSAAQSASMTVNGIAVTSQTNTVSEAIQGVTLTAAKVGTSAVSISTDNSGATAVVNGFIKAYNDLNKTIADMTAYDPETKKGGPLLGDSTTRNIQSSLRKMFGTSVPGLTGNLTNLSQIGIAFQKDGSLSLDSTKFQNAISNNADDVVKLFASAGSATDTLVKYTASTSSTQAGTYAVNVTNLATQGSITGALAAGTSINSGNDELALTIDGVNANVSLTAGTYTASSLAAHIQSVINGNTTFSGKGIAVTVTETNGVLKITSNRYGSASNVSVSGEGALNLMQGTSSGTAGSDVVGTIGGVAAVGSGQMLTGGTSSPAQGLALKITGTATGDRGAVSFSKGYSAHFSSVVDGFLGSKGLIASKNDGINQSIKNVDRQIDKLNERLEATEKRYLAQFTQLDTMMSSMTQTSSFLTQQLAQLAKNI